jgi:hypothetical protein
LFSFLNPKSAIKNPKSYLSKVRSQTLFSIALVTLFLSPQVAQASSIEEEYKYIQKTPKGFRVIGWILEKRGSIKVTISHPRETSIVFSDPLLETLRWRFQRPEQDTDLEAERTDDAILVSGVLKGKYVEKKIPIDTKPWFQATSLSLRRLVLSEQRSLEFRMLRPDTLEFWRFEAEKEETEVISFNGKRVEVQRVCVRPAGVLSLLFSASYWFRKADGLFMKFKGPGSPPRFQETTIELVPESSEKAGSGSKAR